MAVGPLLEVALVVFVAVLALVAALAGRGPRADHRIRPAGHARGRHLEDEAGHVLIGQHVLAAVDRAQRIQVHQVERFGQVHHEALTPLSDEETSRRASGNGDVVDVVAGVLRVVRK